MTYEEMFAACNALSDCALRMRKPGDWYVDHHAEVKVGCMLEGRYGNGTTPQAAIEDHWKELTNLKLGESIVIHAGDKDRRRSVRWNGYMWQDTT